jgi:glycosyltransferase involved in cell wall biosynthesis
VKPGISFIIPVRNDSSRLRDCLRSIFRTGYARNQIEIIVIDNGSTDDSATVAASLGARVLHAPQGRVSELRNRGAQLASADVLAFVDADHEIVSGWVYAALSALQRPNVGAAGALCHAPSDGTWVQRVYDYLRGTLRGQQEVDWLGSGNLVVRRSVFEALGGFDTSLDTCEDVDLCHRLIASGQKIVSDPRLKNIHHGDPRTLREVFAGERWRGRDNLRVSFRRPITWSAVPSAIIPIWHVLLVVIAAIGLAELAVVGRFGLLVLGTATAAFVAPTWLRVIQAASREGRLEPGRMFQAFAVACAYDCGRALALVSRAPHRNVQPDKAKAA